MGGRILMFCVLTWALWACGDAAQGPGCDALGVRLALGEETVDEAACVVCVCVTPGLPTCTPWQGCPDRGRPPPAPDGALTDQGSRTDDATNGPADAGLDARVVPTEDPDGDGQPTDVERVAGTDPFDPDSFSPRFVRVPAGGEVRIDTELTPRLRGVDLAFVVDATSSMQPVIDGLVTQLALVAQDLAGQIPNARYGLGVFRDYAQFNGRSHFPFQLRAPLDPDVELTINALRDVRALGGGDNQETAYEALQQALTGAGYDENCDGAFTPGSDVLPYVSQPRDAFGGNVVGTVMGDAGRLGKGGVGFAPDALPVVILATDAPPRDPETDRVPGGCPFDAGEATVVAAARILGAKVITLFTKIEGGPVPPEYYALAEATGSMLPGRDGALQPLVYELRDPAALRNRVLRAVTALLGGVGFEAATVVGEARPPAVVARPMPAAWGPIAPADYGRPRPVSAVLEATDGGRRIVSLDLKLSGEGGVVLDRQQWWVLVE